ncbi:GNAT family N-acetyltransferase [Mycoplasmatota bacterium WC44]
MVVIKTDIESIDWDLLVELYYQVDGVIGLGKQKNKSRIMKSFMNSYKVVTAWENGQIVGAGRLISDGYCYGWIHDIGVLERYRRQGIGRMIVNELMNVEEQLLFGLTSSFMAINFYKELGFKNHKTAMAKYPGKSTYLED